MSIGKRVSVFEVKVYAGKILNVFETSNSDEWKRKFIADNLGVVSVWRQQRRLA